MQIFHLLDFETLLFGTLWWGRIDVLPVNTIGGDYDKQERPKRTDKLAEHSENLHETDLRDARRRTTCRKCFAALLHRRFSRVRILCFLLPCYLRQKLKLLTYSKLPIWHLKRERSRAGTNIQSGIRTEQLTGRNRQADGRECCITLEWCK